MEMHRVYLKAGARIGEVTIYRNIGIGFPAEEWISAEQFSDNMRNLGNINNLVVRLNSGGGDIFDAMTIYQTIRRFPGPKEVSIEGAALSAATIVAMAGDTISMAGNGMMMIHDPEARMPWSNSASMRKQADILDRIKENIVSTYAQRTKAAPERIRNMMSATTWMTAQEAMQEGFVDSVTGSVRNSLPDISIYGYEKIPQNIIDYLKKQTTPTPRLDLVRGRVTDCAQRVAAYH